MPVLSFASLKGGVGKTSLSLNVAHALSDRGCQTLIIDLDPSRHASRLLLDPMTSRRTTPLAPEESDTPLAELFLRSEQEADASSLLEGSRCSLLTPVRGRLDILPSGGGLRHFLWGAGAQLFRKLFPILLEELNYRYDFIIIDTAPDWNVVTRNALAQSDLVVVPIDSSEMSIACLEELTQAAQHLERPKWCIARTMVSRAASRVQKMSQGRLEQNSDVLQASSIMGEQQEEEQFFAEADSADAERYIELLKQREDTIAQHNAPLEEEPESPIYLLNSVIHRTEMQNRLSFQHKTAFDSRQSQRLAAEYLAAAREIEELWAFMSADEESFEDDQEVDFESYEMQASS